MVNKKKTLMHFMLGNARCIFLLPFLLIAFSRPALSQQQWKFHLAFEDATGERDTIWMIWDSTATSQTTGMVDTALGEQGISFDYSTFNVWIYNAINDSTKSYALPYLYQTLQVEVRGFNFTYPLTIRWDSSLFHSPILPPLPVGYVNLARIDNDYFFFQNNCASCQEFDMLLNDSAYAPSFTWFSQEQFPMTFTLSRKEPIGIDKGINSNNVNVKVFPNPCTRQLKITSEVEIKAIELFDILGATVMENFEAIEENRKTVDIELSHLKPGIYFLKITNTKNQTQHEKFIKNY